LCVCGGFVGTKSFIDCAFDLGSQVGGRREFEDDGELFSVLGLRVRTEALGDLRDRFVVLRRELVGLARSQIVDGGIGRTSGFAFGSTRTGGPLGIAPVGC